MTATFSAPIAWGEKGNVEAGLGHILFRRAGEFLERGVAAEGIPKPITNAVTGGKSIGYQGADKGKPSTTRCTTEELTT
ncbi:hypothetical protein FCH28_15920 [Streptomyces piniterrae]|uniref:Uncharacterized protein n=2 Tax=Streptomyces piniterrae TaxID=2571125 RepID=A0A4U0NJT2_9ACTN|nr:hypothetical protein FCH28_15920 [Streptomyces piniterrae]